MSLIWLDLFKAFALGLVAGLTEFIPVSASGHLLLIERFFGFGDDANGRTFGALIELGALLGLLAVYLPRLWRLVSGMAGDPATRRFLIGLLIAFLPAAILGVLAHDYFRGLLLNIWIVCFALIVGGGVLLWVDRLELAPRHHDATAFPLPMYLMIGFAQCLALIPGVSPAGVTIVAALLLGAKRRAAAEFSLWLATPTLAGAVAQNLYQDLCQNRTPMSPGNFILGTIGFATAAVAAWCVVKAFPDYVARHGLQLFAWWRVIVGSLGLIALALAG